MSLKKIEKSMTGLVLDEPFYASLALRLNIVESKEVPTFSVDGKNLFFNPDFSAQIKPEETKTVLSHEVLHCALGHLWRMPKGADLKIWNEAADHEVNWILEEVNLETKRKNPRSPEPWPFPFRESICLAPEFKGLAAEKIYDELIKNKKPEKQKKPGQSEQGGIGDFTPETNKGKAEQLKEEWEKATIQAAKVAKKKGKLPGSLEKFVEEITNPKVCWKVTLRDFLRDIAKDDWSFLKINQRYNEADFFLPGLYSERAGKIVFAVDTSGSCWQDIPDFLTEAQSCLDELSPEKLSIVTCDYNVSDIKHYSQGDKIDGNFRGGGGTSFIPVFEAIENGREDLERPDVLVYLTDLEGSFPEEPDFPVIWVTKNKNISAPFGNVITIE